MTQHREGDILGLGAFEVYLRSYQTPSNDLDKKIYSGKFGIAEAFRMVTTS